MPTPQEYIDEGVRSGIPLEVITDFLNRNPGDYHRIMSGLAPNTASVNALPRDTISLFTTASTAPSSANLGGIIGGVADAIDRLFPGRVGDIIGDIGGVIGPLFGGGGAPNFPSFQLPLPGGTPRPQLPPAGGSTINIPVRTQTGGISRARAGRIAAAAAAAAAAGLTLEQYLSLNPNALKTHRRINVLNPRALRRAGRRVEGFACFARKMISFSEKTRIRGVKKGCRKRGRCAA